MLADHFGRIFRSASRRTATIEERDSHSICGNDSCDRSRRVSLVTGVPSIVASGVNRPGIRTGTGFGPPKNESQPLSSQVSVRRLTMVFGELVILSDVDLTFAPGEFVSLIGASGCGKTTLLNLIAGLLSPSGGSLSVGDERITGPGADRSMVFQEDAVFPWYTVNQNIEFGLRFLHISKHERRQRTEELLDLVGLSGRGSAYPRELSGGMRKRVDVARALALEPRVLLMDEPFAALDSITKARLQSEFLRIWDQKRMTVIFVTHDIEEALFLSDRVILLSSAPGRVAHELVVPFPRPRNDVLRTSSDLQQMRAELLEALRLAH